MLKLKKLHILGFKSFCDRTEMKFHGEGMAAVVGPNGCGKSNISDAISWVLGEQSAKTLRGVRMEDVIFAGTRERKPLGMAEVSLTLIDPEIYDGVDLSAEPQIEIEDDLHNDDWDEAELRTAAAEDADATIEELQPGQVIGDDGQPVVQLEATGTAENLENDASAKQPGAVVLKIRRRRVKPNHFKAGEIVVTRRLFRSGTSEYLLNGKICRLRDIQDIFMGTGLGPESYAIIEQGRIGQILSSKPYDRRAIIEEAAGITKYKTRKRLAEARLEQAKLNLARIDDIFDEVTRQMNSLKRQAAKAERYSRLRDEMRAKLRIVLASKFSQMSMEAARVDAELTHLAENIRQRSEVVEHMESEHSERTQRGYAVDQESTDTRDRINAIRLEADRGSARRSNNEERCAELVARGAAAEGELQRTTQQLQALLKESASNRAILESASADVAAAQSEHLHRQQKSADAASAVNDLERLQESRRANVMDLMSNGNRVRNQIAQGEENLAAQDRESQRLEREMAAAFAEIESMSGRRGQLGFDYETESLRVSAAQSRITEVRVEIADKRAAETLAKRRLDGLRGDHATAVGKRNSLESVIAEHGYSTESVKRLFQTGAMEGGLAPVGVLADFLAVDDKYEGVVEDFLRDELNYIVVKSWDAADEGLRLLRADANGRATFLVHPSDSQAKFSFLVDEAHRPMPPRDTVVPLTRCIQVLNGFGKSLEVILPKLRDGFIVPDAGLGRELALENPDAFYLAPTGETFHNVTVTGGKQRSEGPLSMKRELREVVKQIADMEQEMRSEDQRITQWGVELAELTSLLANLENELRESEKQAMTHGHALQQMEAELARSQQRLDSFRLESERVNSLRAEKLAAIAQLKAELEGYESLRERLEGELASAIASAGQLKQARDESAQIAAEVAVRLAELEERRRGAAASLQRIESLATEVSSRVETLRGQLASFSAEREQRVRGNLEIAEKLQSLTAERAQATAREAELHAESEQIRIRLAEIESGLKHARIELDAARDHRGELSATAAKLRSDIEHMGETCLNELNIGSDELRGDLSITLLDGEALAAEDAVYRGMRNHLESMGPVNMMALEEYKETAERHQFLETQRKDLQDSIENTQNTIKEIDTMSRQKFEDAFHKINENFQRTFTKLFGGGQGFMRLTDEENATESGIDIVASPPGKKLQNVLLLSGGEKALTALALLVGIFQYQPSPFCILDEVDAPLDEANVGRFADLVREMSVRTQFILITHSKRTMEAAPVMYGVTMQEPGVSKLVSVRFGEEKQLASA